MSMDEPTTPQERNPPGARVLGSGDGEILSAPDTVRDRLLEDEYSYVLEGRVGALLGEEEVFGEVGDLIFKSRGQWHTFWNAGDAPARILETISPGGFEEAFREMHTLGEDLNPATVAEIGVRYGAEIDSERTRCRSSSVTGWCSRPGQPTSRLRSGFTPDNRLRRTALRAAETGAAHRVHGV